MNIKVPDIETTPSVKPNYPKEKVELDNEVVKEKAKGIDKSFKEVVGDLFLYTYKHDKKWITEITTREDEVIKQFSNVKPLWVSLRQRDDEIIRIFMRELKLEREDVLLQYNDAIKHMTHSQKGKEVMKAIKDDDAPEWFMVDKVRFNAEIVATQITNEAFSKGSNYITLEDTGEIYQYIDGIYVPKVERKIKNRVIGLIGNFSCKKYCEEVVYYMQQTNTIKREDLNKKNGDVNLMNGVYNVYKHTFREHSRTDMFTYKYPIVYNPDATCPLIEGFLNETLETALDVELIKEEMSYCFEPSHKIQRYFMHIGSAGTGKGTLHSLIRRMFGNVNICETPLEHLEHDKNYTQGMLYGMVANIDSDVTDKDLKHTSFIKKVTGEDGVTVRNIRKDPFTLYNTAKFFFGMNNSPKINNLNKDDGVFRRIIPTYFRNVILEKNMDKDLRAKLHSEEEISGLFNVLMKSLTELLERGDFCKTNSILENLEILGRDSDPVQTFFDEEVEEFGTVGRERLRERYNEWCCEKNISNKKMEKTQFGKELKKVTKGLHLKTQKPYSGKREWVGISLSKDKPEQFNVPGVHTK